MWELYIGCAPLESVIELQLASTCFWRSTPKQCRVYMH